MSRTSWAIDIDRDDITQARLVADQAAPLAAGQVRVHIDSYAMTANNITYAVFGKPSGLFGNDQGYWDFFAEPDAPGRLPVWGFATVTNSATDGISVGDRFYGYCPMASHTVMVPGQPVGRSWGNSSSCVSAMPACSRGAMTSAVAV